MEIVHFLGFLFITAFGKVGLFPSSGGKVSYMSGPDGKSHSLSPPKTKDHDKITNQRHGWLLGHDTV